MDSAERTDKAPRGDIAAAVVPGEFEVFYDIEVVPTRQFGGLRILSDGGPVWPHFGQLTGARHFRRNNAVDVLPEPQPGPHLRIERPCVWGGFAMAHFGHLIADHLQRILQSRVLRPDDLYLFVLPPDQGPGDVPGYFWRLIEWYGLRRDQVHFVTEPTMVAELRVMPQAEPYGMTPPSAQYLDLLADNAARMGVQPVASDLVYVGRQGLLADGKGGHAGEGYLIGLLQQCGVRVLDPAKASIADQVAAYAGAATLVFVEGSALHGRQLLGRIDQKIVVLCRRSGNHVAEAALGARCREVVYVDAIRRFVEFYNKRRVAVPARGMSFYNLDRVFAVFAELGVDLAAQWDAAAFAKAEAHDAREWLDSLEQSGRLGGFGRRAVLADFAAEGIAPEAKA